MRSSWTPLRAAVAGAGVFLLTGLLGAAEPDKTAKARSPAEVAAAIDREINDRLAKDKVPISPKADDAEFLRRVYLDVTGRIPTAEQASAFLDSKDADKRAKLIDELLASENYGKNFAIKWSDLIVKRDEMNRGLQTAAFKKWLAEGFNSGRGWDEMVRDMLTAEGESDKVPQTTFILACRDMGAVSPPKVVDATVNLFMGVQLNCAQCHKHPFVREWKQEDFWGVAAFFGQTRANGGAQNQPNAAVTIAEGPASGGGRGQGGFRGPSVSGPKIEIPDAVDPRKRTGKVVKAKFFQGEEPQLEDKGPYRPAFAKWLTGSDNKFFAPAIANRTWAHFFGHGFVNALDDMKDDNPPSHPESLKLLAEEFRASGHDVKHLIRCICNTEAYQRTSRPEKGTEDDTTLISHQAVKVMSPEMLYDSLCLAMGVSDLSVSPGGGGRGFGGGFGRGGPPGGRDGFVAFFSTKEDLDDNTEMGMGVPQFLRLMNSAQFNRPAATVDRVMKDQKDPDKVIEGLFLATLSRRPTPEQAKKFAAYVAKKSDPKDGYTGVLWVLVNSAEFICNR
jgi:Protein of unknown function (DUF1549)/Protein of unknown function (DUF1553)